LAITAFVLGMFAVCSMPNRLNNTDPEEDPIETGADNESVASIKENLNISMLTLLGNRNGLIVFLTFLMTNIQFFSFSSTLSPYLVNYFQVQSSHAGLFYSGLYAIYTLTCPLIGWACSKVKALNILLLSLFLFPIGLLLLGPS